MKRYVRTRLPDFNKVRALGFTHVNGTLWVHPGGVCLTLNEDYKRTWQAFDSERPYWQNAFKNEKGHAIRFRSPETAAAHALKQKIVKPA